jgi:predicted acyl esterase
MKRLLGSAGAMLAVGVACAAGAAPASALTTRGSVEQVQVTGVRAGSTVALVNRRGHRVQSRRASRLGALVFREVAPGRGYRVVTRGRHPRRSRPVTVLSQRSAPPTTRIYGQALKEGYGYLTTRDGTKLAVDVHLPGPADQGPYPTLIEYAGYGYADPAGGESSIAQIPQALGFAVVDVNMRGTGCSGGAFDYFEPLQGLDGYDVIETVARQPWAAHHRVGMMGISYGGISQLFVAATRPPSLAAIAPLSVIDNTATTLYPGGILNTGFAFSWAKDRVHDALPASPTGGQPWALEQIRKGDRVCRANQTLHSAAVDLLAKSRANAYWVPKVAGPLAPITFVDKIDVPVFLACQFTDEQTGGHCPDLAQHFTGTTRKWFTFTNGTHIDSLDPATFTRWYDFLELYVARQAPRLSDTVKGLAPTIFSTAFGIPGVTLPDDPIQAQPSYAAALAAFEQLPSVRILFDNGAGAAPGLPVPGFEQSFPAFPLPGTTARSWYLGAGGALSDAPAAAESADGFTWNPEARSATDFTGPTDSHPAGLWTATPTYHWEDNPAGTAVSYVSDPLTADTTVVGAGGLTAWVKASTPDVDLQVTISEVRPDGNETYVQSGYLRASKRALDRAQSTELQPVLSLRKAAAAPLPAGRWTELTVPLYYQGHAYRAGSRLRVTVSAVGGDQPVWAFAETAPARGASEVSIAHAPSMPSRLVLPVVPGVSVPTALPPCPGLRGEPCRPYVARANRSAALTSKRTSVSSSDTVQRRRATD